MPKILRLSAELLYLLTAMLVLPIEVTAGDDELPYPVKVPLELRETLYEGLAAQERALNRERGLIQPSYTKHNVECGQVEKGTPQEQACLLSKEQLQPKIKMYLERIAAHRNAVDGAKRRNCQEIQVLYELHHLEKTLAATKDPQAAHHIRSQTVLHEKRLDEIRSAETNKDTAVQQLLPANVDCSKVDKVWYSPLIRTAKGAATGRFQGKVYIEYRGGQVRFDPNVPIVPGDKIITGTDGRVRLVWSDGSRVEMGPNSTFTVRDETDWTFESRFGLLYYKLKQMKNRRYKVRAGAIMGGVRGTEFTIESKEDEPAIITVLEGAFQVYGQDESWQQELITAGQQAVISPQGTVQSIGKVDLSLFARWWETGLGEAHSP